MRHTDRLERDGHDDEDEVVDAVEVGEVGERLGEGDAGEEAREDGAAVAERVRAGERLC